MTQGLLFLPIVLPALFWAVYHYHKDRHLPEPIGNLLLCFGLGIVAAGLSKAMYLGLEPLGLRFDAVALADSNGWALLAYALLAIGPIEELAKMLPFLLVVIRLKAFDEPLDGIVYASFMPSTPRIVKKVNSWMRAHSVAYRLLRDTAVETGLLNRVIAKRKRDRFRANQALSLPEKCEK